jgi:hypothetical protein
MPIAYRLIDSSGTILADADTIRYLRGLVGDLEPGRYVVDEISHDEIPSAPAHISRRWGVIRKLADGTVIMEPIIDES